MRIQSREQRRPRGAAARGVVELRETQPARRELVEVRRGDFAAVAAEVGEAHVIDEDDDDVGFRRSLNEIAKGNAQIKQVTEQVNHFMAAITDSATVRSFREKAKAITDSLDAVKNELFNEKIQADEDNLRFPLKLEEKIALLNFMLQSADSKPTASMHTVYNSLSAQIDIQLLRLKNILDQKVPEFNTLAGSIQKPPLDTRVKD